MAKDTITKPPELEACVQDLLDQGYDEDSAYAICNAAMKRAGGPPDVLTIDLRVRAGHDDMVIKAYGAETAVTKDGDLEAYVSTETVDRVGDSVPVKAWELDNYVKTGSPVLAFHEYGLVGGQVPVVGNAITIEKQRKGLLAVTRFHDKTQLSRDLHALYRDGNMKAFSVGFRSLQAPDMIKDDQERITGYRFTKVELLEYSVVAVPANPDAIVRALKSKSISRATAAFIAGQSPAGGSTGSGGEDARDMAVLEYIQRQSMLLAIKGVLR